MSTTNLYEVIRAPRVSEKTARLQEVSNQYVFDIAKTATKNTVNVKGKAKAFKNRQGRRNDWKKAYVTLAEGQSIDVMTASA